MTIKFPVTVQGPTARFRFTLSKDRTVILCSCTLLDQHDQTGGGYHEFKANAQWALYDQTGRPRRDAVRRLIRKLEQHHAYTKRRGGMDLSAQDFFKRIDAGAPLPRAARMLAVCSARTARLQRIADLKASLSLKAYAASL